MAELITVAGGAKPDVSVLDSRERVPWQGHSSRYAIPEIYELVKAHRTTLLFVNTRSQAELLFAELWRINEDYLPIALHHGSLDVSQRRRVEKAMETNSLRAIVATSTLDLGIDWGDVDLVIHVGAPKGASRLAQRIGRSNHRMDEPSKAILVPSNRFEVLECRAALEAIDRRRAGHAAAARRRARRAGAACARRRLRRALRRRRPLPRGADRRALCRARPRRPSTASSISSPPAAMRCAPTSATPASARPRKGCGASAIPRIAQQYRLNVGTIIEVPALNVRYVRHGKGPVARGGPVLGKIEEAFLETLVHGDTFLFAGKVLRFEGIRENECFVSNAPGKDAKVPYYGGGKFPLSTYLADQVRGMLADPKRWKALPEQVADWLRLQAEFSVLPKRGDLLVETFPNGNRFYMVAYPFEGRLAHQTLGMLLTRRLERAGARPLGFVATDYVLGVWALGDMGAMFKTGKPSLGALFDEDMLGDDLDAWLADSWMLKRTFRACAQISGLIEKRFPGQEKSGRQVTVSADLIYDVLRTHEPDHILLQATRADAAAGLLDVRRLADMLSRIKGRIMHKDLDRISPLAVPIMLEVGRERVDGEAGDSLLSEAEELIAEAMGQSKGK